MRLLGVLPESIHEAVSIASSHFAWNVELRRLSSISSKGTSWIVTLKVKDARGAGAVQGEGGRRTPSACWHVQREFLRALYERHPIMKVRTAVEEYECESHFHTLTSHGPPKRFAARCECKEGM